MKLMPFKLLKVILDCHGRFSVFLGQLFTGIPFDPPQSRQLREIKSWLPPLDRVGFYLNQWFSYPRMAGTKISLARNLIQYSEYCDLYSEYREAYWVLFPISVILD